MWDLSSLTRNGNRSSALEGEVPTPGLPGKSLSQYFMNQKASNIPAMRYGDGSGYMKSGLLWKA